MPPVRCMNCMDAGVIMYDGVPRACGSCDAGRDYAANGGQRLGSVPRRELDPRTLPPGGDVMITEMKRQAAGLPVGVIGSDTLVRAQIESQPLVHDLVRLLDDFTRDVPGVNERAIEFFGGLPEWAIPDDVRNREDGQAEVEGQEALELAGAVAGPAAPVPISSRRQRKQTAPSSAPLEPPGS